VSGGTEIEVRLPLERVLAEPVEAVLGTDA
jgi:hypothetical protein